MKIDALKEPEKVKFFKYLAYDLLQSQGLSDLVLFVDINGTRDLEDLVVLVPFWCHG